MPDHEFWLAVRQALLLIVAAIERLDCVRERLKLTTKECHDIARQVRKGV